MFSLIGLDAGYMTSNICFVSFSCIFPGRGISLADFSQNFEENIILNTDDHMDKVPLWTWNVPSLKSGSDRFLPHYLIFKKLKQLIDLSV